MKKRVLSLLLCLVMLVSMFPAVYAESEVDTAVTPGEIVPDEIVPDDGIVVVEPEEPAADAPADAGAGVPDGTTEEDGNEPTVDAAAAGADAPADPTETDGETPAENTDVTPEESPVRVVFVCNPEETEITVYDPEVLDEYGEPVVIEPEEDESFLLLPGKYCYDAAAEGYIALEEEAFTVEAAEEDAPPQEIRVTLEAVPVETDDETDDDADDETPADDAAAPDETEPVPAADDGSDNGETPATDAAGEALRVRFVTEPETAEITLYDPAQRDEFDRPVVIAPEADGTYSLLPGSYCYDAWAEGFISLDMAEFTLEPGTDGENDPVEIRVVLEPKTPDDALLSYGGDVVDCGPCGDGVYFTLDSSGEMVIFGSGAINRGAFKNYAYRSSFKRLIISEKVSSIGYEAFYGCTSLASVTIQTDTALSSIVNWAFERCSSLSSVTFLGAAPSSIGSYAFYGDTATVRYSSVFSSWTASKRQNYGGKLSWVDTATQTDFFVARAYRQILNREPDPTGLVSWTSALRNGSVTGATLVNGFITSKEFINRKLANGKVVEILYNVMLNRTPDSAGKANWTNYLDNGLSYSFIVNGFAGSQEFRNICAQYGINPGSLGVGEYRDMNPNVTFFVSRCYKLILNRTPDAAGLNDWTGALLRGTQTGATVVNGFVRSNEFVNRKLSNAKVVEILYNVMLNRAPDTDGKAFWVAFLNDGATYSFIVNGFAGSQEFINLCASYGIQAGSLVLTDTSDRCGHLYSVTAQGNKVTLNWMAGVDPTSYTIRYGYSKNNLSGYVSGIAGNARSYTITGLKKNTTYYFAISTVIGQSTIASSRVISVKTGNYDGINEYRALVIGEGNCPGQTSLPGAQNAQMMVNILSNVNGGKIRISRYVDQSKSSILSLIPSAFSGADDDDVSYFFISSHGDSSSGANRKAGAICTTGGYGEMLYLDELSSALAAVPGWVVVFVNTCGSGAGVYPYGTDGDQTAADEDYDAFSDQVISAFAAVDQDMTLMQETTYFNEEGEVVRVEETPYEAEEDEFLSYVGEWKKSKFQVLVSSAFQENSWAYSNGSVFVYALSNAVGTSGRMPADTDGNRWATLQELYVYTYNTVTSWTDGKQHPKVYPANSSFVVFYR